jgi:hypothetical protein
VAAEVVNIPADQVVLDPQPAAAASTGIPTAPQATPQEIPADQVVLDSDRYSAPGQKLLAHAEAAGRGLAGPLATAAERAIGVPAEDIKQREEANPEARATEAATFGVSALTGVGEAELIGRAGMKAAEVAEAAAVTSRAAKLALRTGVETALMQSGDNVNKMILGDPASAADVALAGGIGLVAGGALGSVPALWKAAKDKTVGRWLRSAGDAVSEAEKTTLTEEVAKKAGKTLFGVPEAATEGYLKNVDGVQKASSELWDVAEKLPKAVSDVGEASGKLSKEARGVLSEERSIPFSQVAETLEGLPSKKVSEELSTLREAIERRGADVVPQPDADKLSQREVRGLMDTLAQDTNFKAPLPTAEKASLRQAYGTLNDVLKTANPEYAKAIGQSAEQVTLKQNLVSKLRLVKDYSSEHGFKPTDTTVSRLKDLMRGDKRDVKDILDSLKKLGHADLAEEVKNTLIKQAFTKDATRGSRLALVGGTTGAALGHTLGIPGGAAVGGAAGSWLGAMADKYGAKAYYDVLGKIAQRAPAELGAGRLKAQHAALPIARAILAEEPSGAGAKAAIDYTRAVVSGESRVTSAVRATVERDGTSLLHLEPSQGDKDRVRKMAEAAQADPGQMLQERNDLAEHMPDNATALVSSKARAAAYLGTLRPQPVTGLPFDEQYTDEQAERRYDRALEVAASPLVVMRHVQKGTLEPDHVKDLNAMYPALGQFIRGKVFEGVVSAKHSDVKPSYEVRQGLSLLLGEPMDSTFLPQSIAAAQAPYQAKAAQAQQPQVTKTKLSSGGKSHLSKLSQAYATSDQAAAARTKGGVS